LGPESAVASVSADDVRDVINVSPAEVPDAKVLKMIKRAEVTLELETCNSCNRDSFSLGRHFYAEFFLFSMYLLKFVMVKPTIFSVLGPRHHNIRVNLFRHRFPSFPSFNLSPVRWFTWFFSFGWSRRNLRKRNRRWNVQCPRYYY